MGNVTAEKNSLTQEEQELQAEFRGLLAKFGDVVLDKLMVNERKYGFGNSWKIPNWEAELQAGLIAHTKKGDPRDTAIYSFFAWYHGWPTAQKPPKKRSLSELTQEEYLSVFAVAFGYAPTLERMHVNNADTILTIHDGLYGLLINANGQILATKGVKSAVEFNAWKVVKVLESYNIAIGEA